MLHLNLYLNLFVIINLVPNKHMEKAIDNSTLSSRTEDSIIGLTVNSPYKSMDNDRLSYSLTYTNKKALTGYRNNI